MASVDDIYNQITKNRNRSYFPAANPQGQIIQRSGAGNAGYGIGNGALPPDQNPAYQAALSRGRLNRNDLTTVYTPSGGTMRVPTSSLGGTLGAVQGSTIQPKSAYSSDYAKGYGAPVPTVQQFTGGPALVQGGVANPIQNLTPQQRNQYGVGGLLDSLRSSPLSMALGNTLGNPVSNLASRIGGFFGGGNFGFPPSASAQQPSPIPTPSSNMQPRRYFDPAQNYGF